MDKDFYKRITASLAYIRKRNVLLNGLAAALVIGALVLLVFARHEATNGGVIPWIIYLAVAACIGGIILLNVAFERDWF